MWWKKILMIICLTLFGCIFIEHTMQLNPEEAFQRLGILTLLIVVVSLLDRLTAYQENGEVR